MARIEEAALKALEKKVGFLKVYYRWGVGQNFVTVNELIKGYREVVNELESAGDIGERENSSREISKGEKRAGADNSSRDRQSRRSE